MSTVRHIIKKQTLDVKLALGSPLHSIQDQLGRICRQTLPGALEQVCNAVCAEEYWIKLNKISLDLGTLPVVALEEKMREKTIEKLAEVLTTAIEVGNMDLNTIKSQKESPASPVELLKYFLFSGTMPSWMESRSINLEQLFDRAMAISPEALCRFLRNAPHKNIVCRRLAGIIEKRQLKTLAALLTNTTAFNTSIDALFSSGNTTSISDRTQLLTLKESVLFYLIHYGSANTVSGQDIPDSGSNEDAKEENVFKKETSQNKRERNHTPVEVLKYFLSTGVLPEWMDSRSVTLEQLFDRTMATAPQALCRFLRHVPHKNALCRRLAGIVQERQLKALAAALTNTNAFDILIDELFFSGQIASDSEQAHSLKIKESLLSYWLHNEQDEFLIPDTGIAERIRKGEIFRKGTSQEIPMQHPEKPAPIHSETQACTIHNAGLVILWPGIPSLFKTCGLIGNDIFVSEVAAERAVLLLQYAVDSCTKIPEFELPLNKILCGLDTDTPVTTVFTPTKAEKAAVQDLLQTVVGEWSALKGSSPEALQVNFLQREGTITPRGDHWQLHIERQTADVLLEQLPWGTGVIKLPWMKHIIYTTW